MKVGEVVGRSEVSLGLGCAVGSFVGKLVGFTVGIDGLAVGRAVGNGAYVEGNGVGGLGAGVGGGGGFAQVVLPGGLLPNGVEEGDNVHGEYPAQPVLTA